MTPSSRPTTWRSCSAHPWRPERTPSCERVVSTQRREALDHMLIYNETHAQAALTDYIQHYNGHRPHQSRAQLPPASDEPPNGATVTDLQEHRSGDDPSWAA
ncbi:integrase core domain-containing protein [Streptomyces sp. NBC_01003]|uniref:integrase core domain-containing protein n=1 Tax=unclassified Streptomyces TaxID=2593676 RepID=UPI00386D776D